MIYRTNAKNGEKLSQLGLGCMRFPQRLGVIDQRGATALVRLAVEGGVNYFDTAYIYPGSEAALGQALQGVRRDVNVATKMPLFLLKSAADFDKYFEQQLARLDTDYIDYYLMHMLVDEKQFEHLHGMGYCEWAQRMKAEGRIRNIGFSFHGSASSFVKIVDAYDWDFCMIQYNYLDEQFQAGTAGLEYAHGKGLPVMVMEPLRGGKLASNLPAAATRAFEVAHPGMHPAIWGLRWVWNHPEVTLLLSGMSNIEQLEANMDAASRMEAGGLTGAELSAIETAREAIAGAVKVGCTGCGYCLPCPAHVDIPRVFSYYNDLGKGGGSTARMHYMSTSGIIPAQTGFATQCKRCGRCEKHCPQSIPIMDTLAAAGRALEPFWMKPGVRVARRVLGKGRG